MRHRLRTAVCLALAAAPAATVAQVQAEAQIQVSTCRELHDYRAGDSHRRVVAVCANREDARQACAMFEGRHGWPEGTYCIDRPKARAYEAGWLRENGAEPGDPFFLGDFRYFVVPEASSSKPALACPLNAEALLEG